MSTLKVFDKTPLDMPIPTLEVDNSGIIIGVSQAFIGEFGYVPSMLIGDKIEVLVPVPKRKMHIQQREGWLKSPKSRWMGSRAARVTLLTERGEEKPVRIALTETQEKTTIAFVIPLRERTNLFSSQSLWANIFLLISGIILSQLTLVGDVALLLTGFGGAGLANLIRDRTKEEMGSDPKNHY